MFEPFFLTILCLSLLLLVYACYKRSNKKRSRKADDDLKVFYRLEQVLKTATTADFDNLLVNPQTMSSSEQILMAVLVKEIRANLYDKESLMSANRLLAKTLKSAR